MTASILESAAPYDRDYAAVHLRSALEHNQQIAKGLEQTELTTGPSAFGQAEGLS